MKAILLQSSTAVGLALSALKRSPTFAGLSMKTLDRLIEMATLHEVGKSTFIFRQGGEVDSYHVIAKGTVRVFGHSPCGREFTIALKGPGATVGDSCLFGEVHALVSVQAVTETLLLSFAREELLSFVLKRADITKRVIQNTTQWLRRYMDCVMSLLVDKAELRVAKVLIILLPEFGSIVSLSHQQISDMAGITRETGSKALKNLADSNVIYRMRGRIAILNKDALKLMCEFPGAGNPESPDVNRAKLGHHEANKPVRRRGHQSDFFLQGVDKIRSGVSTPR